MFFAVLGILVCTGSSVPVAGSDATEVRVAGLNATLACEATEACEGAGGADAGCPDNLRALLESLTELFDNTERCCKDPSKWKTTSCLPPVIDDLPEILDGLGNFLAELEVADVHRLMSCQALFKVKGSVLFGSTGQFLEIPLWNEYYDTRDACGMLEKERIQDLGMCGCEEPEPECCCYAGGGKCFSFTPGVLAQLGMNNATQGCPAIEWQGQTACPRPRDDTIGVFYEEPSAELSTRMCPDLMKAKKVNLAKVDTCPGGGKAGAEAAFPMASKCCCYRPPQGGYVYDKSVCFNVHSEHLKDRHCPPIFERKGVTPDQIKNGEGLFCPSDHGDVRATGTCDELAFNPAHTFPSSCSEEEAQFLNAQVNALKTEMRKAQCSLHLEAKDMENAAKDMKNPGLLKEDTTCCCYQVPSYSSYMGFAGATCYNITLKEGSKKCPFLDKAGTKCVRAGETGRLAPEPTCSAPDKAATLLDCKAAEAARRGRSIALLATAGAVMPRGVLPAARASPGHLAGGGCTLMEPAYNAFASFVESLEHCMRKPSHWASLTQHVVPKQLSCIWDLRRGIRDVIEPVKDIVETFSNAKNTGTYQMLKLIQYFQFGCWGMVTPFKNKADRARQLLEMGTAALGGKAGPKQKEQGCMCPEAQASCCCYMITTESGDDKVHCYDFSGRSGCPRLRVFEAGVCPLDAEAGVAHSPKLSDEHCGGDSKGARRVGTTGHHKLPVLEGCKAKRQRAEKRIQHMDCLKTKPSEEWDSPNCKPPPADLKCCYTDKWGEDLCWKFNATEHIPFRTQDCPPVQHYYDPVVGCPVSPVAEINSAVNPKAVAETAEAKDYKTPPANFEERCSKIWAEQTKALTYNAGVNEQITGFLSKLTCCCYQLPGSCCTSKREVCYSFWKAYHPQCPNMKYKGGKNMCRVDAPGGIPSETNPLRCNLLQAPLWGTDHQGVLEGVVPGQMAYCEHVPSCCCYSTEGAGAKALYPCFRYNDDECPAHVYWHKKQEQEAYPCPVKLAEHLMPAGHQFTEGKGRLLGDKGACPQNDPGFQQGWCGTEDEIAAAQLKKQTDKLKRVCCCYEHHINGYFYGTTPGPVCMLYPYRLTDNTRDENQRFEASEVKEGGHRCPRVKVEQGTYSRKYYGCPWRSKKDETSEVALADAMSDSNKECAQIIKTGGDIPKFKKVTQTWCEANMRKDLVRDETVYKGCKDKLSKIAVLNKKPNPERRRTFARVQQAVGPQRSGRETGQGAGERSGTMKGARRARRSVTRRVLRGLFRMARRWKKLSKPSELPGAAGPA